MVLLQGDGVMVVSGEGGEFAFGVPKKNSNGGRSWSVDEELRERPELRWRLTGVRTEEESRLWPDGSEHVDFDVSFAGVDFPAENETKLEVKEPGPTDLLE